MAYPQLGSYSPTGNRLAFNHQESPAFRYGECQLNSTVLKNKAGIKDQVVLDKIDQEITQINQAALEQNFANTKFDVYCLKDIHKAIFQDIYNFAGDFRIEDISKGQTRFLGYENINQELSKLLVELKTENYLQNLSQNNFIKRAAYYMIELNMIHPFREGNGRSIRFFIRQLSINAGHEIDWVKVDPTRMLNAIIAGVVVNYKPLEECLRTGIVDRERPIVAKGKNHDWQQER